MQFFRNITIHKRFWQCFVVNGLIFLGSLAWLHIFVLPLACAIVQLDVAQQGDAPSAATAESSPPSDGAGWLAVQLARGECGAASLFSSVYHLLWVLPMYLVTMLLVSPPLYNEIACAAFAVSATNKVRTEGENTKPMLHIDVQVCVTTPMDCDFNSSQWARNRWLLYPGIFHFT
eukprot:SAG11_NODE_1412_length_4985_cov_14.954769_1_plen_175_part_00